MWYIYADEMQGEGGRVAWQVVVARVGGRAAECVGDAFKVKSQRHAAPLVVVRRACAVAALRCHVGDRQGSKPMCWTDVHSRTIKIDDLFCEYVTHISQRKTGG